MRCKNIMFRKEKGMIIGKVEILNLWGQGNRKPNSWNIGTIVCEKCKKKCIVTSYVTMDETYATIVGNHDIFLEIVLKGKSLNQGPRL